jgi:hypothetical protein
LHSVSSSILPRHSPYHPFGRGWHRLQHSHIEAFRSWVWSSKNWKACSKLHVHSVHYYTAKLQVVHIPDALFFL